SARAESRAASSGVIPSSRRTSRLRSEGECSENAASCFCSANTEARKAPSSIPSTDSRYRAASRTPSDMTRPSQRASRRGGGVDAAKGPAHQVQVALVLELHLGDAVAADAGRSNLFFGRAGLAPQGPHDGLEQRGLARSVGPVNADQAGRQLQVQLVLVDP